MVESEGRRMMEGIGELEEEGGERKRWATKGEEGERKRGNMSI